MKPSAFASSSRAYQRGEARADRLVADLACGQCDAERFVMTVAAALNVDSETLGLVATLAERLAAIVVARGGASDGEGST